MERKGVWTSARDPTRRAENRRRDLSISAVGNRAVGGASPWDRGSFHPRGRGGQVRGARPIAQSTGVVEAWAALANASCERVVVVDTLSPFPSGVRLGSSRDLFRPGMDALLRCPLEAFASW